MKATTDARQVGWDPLSAFCRLALVVATMVGGVPRGAACQEESDAARRARLEAMAPAQKEELRSKKQQFDQFSPEQQEQLRQLHKDICGDPDSERLHHVMLRYNEWLRALPAERRAELYRLSPDERLTAIKKTLEEQERQRFQEMVRKLDPHDVDVIKTWFGELVQRDIQSLLGTLPLEDQQRLQDIQDPWARLMEAFRMRKKQARETSLQPFDLVRITDADIRQLQSQLSRPAAEMLNEIKDSEDKAAAVKDWIRVLAFSRDIPRVSDEELRRFLRERVDAKTRDYLENLPRDRMMGQLRWMYFAQRYWSRGGEGSGRPPFRSFGPGDFRPPFDGFPPRRGSEPRRDEPPPLPPPPGDSPG